MIIYNVKYKISNLRHGKRGFGKAPFCVSIPFNKINTYFI